VHNSHMAHLLWKQKELHCFYNRKVGNILTLVIKIVDK
jgi:hypothetical protein